MTFSTTSPRQRPKVIRALDCTLHAFPADTPQTDIEQYLWRYENGQDLPRFAFSARFDQARRECRKKVYMPPQSEHKSSTRSVQRVKTTTRRKTGDGALGPRLENFNNPGAVFDSREAAAYDITSQVNPISKEQNREFTWTYYADPVTGKIGYSDPYAIGRAGGKRIPVPLTNNGAALLASDGTKLRPANTFGGGHTHGRASENDLDDPNDFSSGRGNDYDVMRRGGEIGTWNYFTLGTPSGRMYQWTPENRREKLENR